MGFSALFSKSSFQAWRMKSWLASYLYQSSAQNYISRFKSHQKNENEELTSNYFLEDSKIELACRICIYSIEFVYILAMLLITTLALKPALPLIPPQGIDNLNFELQVSKNVLNIIILLAIRCAVSLNYALNSKFRGSYHYCLNKLIQLISIFLFRIHFSSSLSLFLCLTLLIEFAADFIYIVCKEQRRGFFDSRLNYFYYLIRATMSVSTTIFYNFSYSYPTHSTAFLCFLILCTSSHCLCIIKDSFYCLLTRNLILIIWTVLLVKTISFFALQQLLQIDFRQKLSSNWILTHIFMFSLSAFIIFLVFRNKHNIQVLSFNGFSYLKQNFNELRSKQAQLRYIWEAIRLISIDPKNLCLIQQTVNNISWVFQYSQSSEESQGNQSRQMLMNSQNEKERKYYLNRQFQRKFSHYCYQLLLDNFKKVNEMKYILIFFFNHKSAEKMLLFLNKINFYDIRQSNRIEKEHRNSDLAAKVNEMIKNQQQITELVKNYVRQLKIFVKVISDEGPGIDLLVCEKIGNQLLQTQRQIKKFGTYANQQCQQKNNKKESLLLSAYSRCLLNIVRKELLGEKQLNYPPVQIDEKQKTISQIMNQQQSLIVLSAELESIGQIIALNCAACKLTGYSCTELVGQNINLLLPEDIKMAHSNQLKEKAVIYKNSQQGYLMKSIVYVIKKNKYCALCELSVKFIDGTMGKRWITKLTQIQQFSPFLICDQDHNIIGLNEAAHRFGFGMDWVGVSLGSWFAQQLLIANHSQKYSNQLCLQLYQKIIKKNAILGLQQIISHSNYLDVKQRRRRKIFGSIIQSVQQNQTAKQINKRVIKFQDELIKVHQQQNSIEKECLGQQKLMEDNKEKIKGNGLLLECNVLSQVHQIGQNDIIGYYVFKMSEVVEEEKNENESINMDVNCLTINFKDKNKDSNRRRNKKYRNTITFTNQNDGINLHELSFKFDYDIIQDKYFNVVENQNNNNKNQERSSRLKQLQESIQEEDCQLRQIRNAEQINELIYINGELEFRQNKKLEQIYQCDTYPLHSNHNFFFEEFGDINREDLTNNLIKQKSEIFELLDHVQQLSQTQAKQKIQMRQKLGRETCLFSKYSKQRIIILVLLFIFFAFGCALITTGFVFLQNQGNQATNKIQTLLLMSQRVNLLNKLALNFERYILLNLRLNLMPSDPYSMIIYSTVSDIIGDMNKWDIMLKQIEQKNNLINQIDLIQNQWMHSNFNNQIQNLATRTDFSSQFSRMSTNLLSLDQLVKGMSEIDKRINSNNKVCQVNIDLNVLKSCLLVIRNLVEETIPMNLYTITKTLRIYSQKTMSASKTIQILSILFALCSLLFGIISYFQISQIIKRRGSNMQILSYFPNQYLQIFYKKLQNFELQISNQDDITSELGIDELEIDNINTDEQLIFHKKKIKKNNMKIVDFIPLFGFLFFLALGLGVMGSLIEVNNLFNCSQKFENWFALTNGRIIEANYLWNQHVMNEGINRLPSIKEYFKPNPVNFISMDALFDNRDYIIMYKKNLENLKSRRFTNNFEQQISELLDKEYCEQVLSSGTGIVCQGKISNFSIETIQTYTELKQLILNKFLKSSLRQKSFEKLQDIVKLFSIKNMELNDDRLMASNKYIITREMSRLKVKNQLSVWKTIIILAVFITIFLFASLWLLYHSQEFTLKPIVVMARCFPLLLLNANQYFQCWFYCTKNKEIR